MNFSIGIPKNVHDSQKRGGHFGRRILVTASRSPARAESHRAGTRATTRTKSSASRRKRVNANFPERSDIVGNTNKDK